MARSFSSVKLISSFAADRVSVAVANTAKKGAFLSNAAAGAGKSKMVAKVTEEASCSMWVPDPVTGYYRPQNQAVQVDAAELRKRLLKNSFFTY